MGVMSHEEYKKQWSEAVSKLSEMYEEESKLEHLMDNENNKDTLSLDQTMSSFEKIANLLIK